MSTINRRSLVGLASALALVSAARGVRAEECVVFDQGRQSALTPDQALQRLMEGNARVLAGKTINCDLVEQIGASAAGQSPFAAVVGCLDSRASPELLFDQRLGSLFVARIAGNFVNTDIIGSLEFATKVSGARLIMVVGHSQCGAIKGAIDKVQLGNLTATLNNVWPAVEATTDVPGERSSKNAAFVQAVAETNARLAARTLTQRSPILEEMVDGGTLKIVPAMQDLATGRVTLLA